MCISAICVLLHKAIELKVNRVAIDKNVVTKPSPFSHQYFTIKHALNGFEHENSKNRIVLLAICLNMNPFILKKTLSRNKYSNSKNLLFLSGIFIVHLVIINLFSLKKDVLFIFDLILTDSQLKLSKHE